jgi:hypothetical protein
MYRSVLTDVPTWAANTDINTGSTILYENNEYQVNPITSIYSGPTFEPTQFANTGTTVLTAWQANVTYQVGDFVNYSNTNYVVRPITVLNTGSTFVANLYTQTNNSIWTANTIYNAGHNVVKNDSTGTSITYVVTPSYNSGLVFTVGDYTVLPEQTLSNAADRTMAFYAPSAGMLPKDLAKLYPGTEYLGNTIDGTNLLHMTESINDVNITEWQANTTYIAGTLVRHLGNVYVATPWAQTATPTGNIIERLSIASPAANFDLTQYMPYTGNTIEYTVDKGNKVELDTIIQSHFADTLLGTRPEDINITGGKFIDIYNSHSPEEMLPGLMSDTLNISVYTIDINDPTGLDPNNAPIGYRISKNMLSTDTIPTVFNLTYDPVWKLDGKNISTSGTTFDWTPTNSWLPNTPYIKYTLLNHNGLVYSVTPSDGSFELAASPTFDLANFTVFTAISTDTAITWVSTASYPINTVVKHNGAMYISIQNTTPGDFDSDHFKLYEGANAFGPTTFDTRSNAWEFKRISKNNTATLVKSLNLTDTEVFVDDVNVLPTPSVDMAIPGIVYINGEKITYYILNKAKNSLGQLRRGCFGTPAVTTHAVGSKVIDASIAQDMPGDPMFFSWLDMEANPTQSAIVTGNGLMASGTLEALFLKEGRTFLPYLPGQTAIQVAIANDPNVNTTRFDDNGLGEIGSPAHGFDDNPFDSYIP